MYVFKIEDPNEGLAEVLGALRRNGLTDSSRNGPVIRFDRPVCLHYPDPRRRLLSSPVRDCNVVFHLFETMWMFAGLCELEPLLLYNPGMAQYSDDERNLRGTAYGYRWRAHKDWGDQICKVVQRLREDPTDRRAVLTMWDPCDLGTASKDYACNLQVIFSTRPSPQDGAPPVLDMTVTNRSNDLIYGAMGSNMFHFSMLLEYVAALCQFEVGSYYQVSSNLHVYTENPVAKRCLDGIELLKADYISQLSDSTLTKLGLTEDRSEIAGYVRNRNNVPEDAYLKSVVLPLVEAYHIFKIKSRTGLNIPTAERIGASCSLAHACASEPLRLASEAWFQRRMKAV